MGDLPRLDGVLLCSGANPGVVGQYAWQSDPVVEDAQVADVVKDAQFTDVVEDAQVADVLGHVKESPYWTCLLLIEVRGVSDLCYILSLPQFFLTRSETGSP